MVNTCIADRRTDLVDAIHDVLKESAEPLTAPRIRERLPSRYRNLRLEDVIEALQRQVAAQVLVICPKYRSRQDRYWDRSLRDHASVVLHDALRGGPMAWADLRKKFPKYLRHLADLVLNEELARGTIFRHTPMSIRMGPRYALYPADVRIYASKELPALLARLEQCGFARHESREALMHLLQEDEWAESAASRPVATSVPVRTDWWEKTMS
jgi:hypothetical protein